MNRMRRAQLRKANGYLDEAQWLIRDILDDGPDQAGQMDPASAELLLSAIKDLKDAYDSIEEAKSCVEDAMA